MIDKLNGVQFTGKADKTHKKNELPEKNNNEINKQQVVVVSKDGARAMRNYALGILAALGTTSMLPSLTSCEQDPDIMLSHEDNLTVNVDYHPIPQKPDTFYITKDSIVRDTIWNTDTIIQEKPIYLPGDTIYQKDTIYQDRPIYLPGDTIYQTDTIIQEKPIYLPGDTIYQKDTIYQDRPIYLPGDTIRDTIKVEIPGETVYIKPDYESEVADSLIAHAKNLGLDVDNGGKIPTRIHAFDQWNSVDHDILFDGKASSYQTMVFTDRMKDYSKDSKNPTLKYGKCEYSVDYGKGVTFEYYESRYEGAKPDSKNDWIPKGKVCLTNLRNGFIQKSTYDENGGLVKVGTFEKGDTNVSFYENLIAPSGYEDSYAWSEAKMYTSNPEK